MNAGTVLARGKGNREERRLAWAYLARVAEPPCEALIALAAEVGPVDAARSVRAGELPEGFGGAVSTTAARREVDRAAADLAAVAKLGGRLVTPDDPEWPAWAFLSLERAPREAGRPTSPPLALWTRGAAPLCDVVDGSVAIVGTRAATAYGEDVAVTLGHDLGLDGRPVVSGAAYGIDGAAHRGALSADGVTAAVLACGLDVPYPSGHRRLLDDIARRGCVVTEYPPGTTPGRHRFLTRNRLVAALARAVIVVEAGRRSGAANTAAWARLLGTPVGAVPGPVTTAASVGTNAMIAAGQALLVADADAVRELAGPIGTLAPITHGPTRRTDGLTARELRVYDALPASGSPTVDELAVSAGETVTSTQRCLIELELKGLVVTDGATWWLP